jgi:threonyl-tRNA synthetase
MLVVGEKERQGGTVAVRRHRLGDQGAVPTGALITQLQQMIHDKSLTS